MKNTINPAQEARNNKVLNTLVNLGSHGIKTRRAFLEQFKTTGKVEEAQEPKVKYNRVKYNRMNWEEQKEYEKKLEEKKTVYRFYMDKDKTSFFDITKIEYDYFNSL